MEKGNIDKKVKKTGVWLGWVFLSVLVILVCTSLQATIYKLEITGPIESITEEYISESFKKIQADPQAKLIIIEMDTPGGISDSMRTIIKTIMSSPIPVVVYVSPKGAQAASAGFLILISADVAAMAPGTNTGAAHPVSLTGGQMEKTMKEKVTNDAAAYARALAKSRNRNPDLAESAVKNSQSYTAQECLDQHLSEYIAENLDHLIKQLDQKTIIPINGHPVTLDLKNETIITLEMSARQKFLKTITNPSLAYFLLIIGLIGLYIEFTNPGVIIPGVLGAICLLLAFLALQVLPINYIGLLLILLSVGFFIAEIKIQGFGMFGVGGIIAFLLGSVMLIDAPIPEMKPTMTIIITCAVCFAGVFMFFAYKVIQAMKQKTETGKEGLFDETGIAKTDISQTPGKVFVHGEWWNAISASGETIPEGTKIKIVSIDGFTLKVIPYGG